MVIPTNISICVSNVSKNKQKNIFLKNTIFKGVLAIFFRKFCFLPTYLHYGRKHGNTNVYRTYTLLTLTYTYLHYLHHISY